jgi:hypothetical protein
MTTITPALAQSAIGTLIDGLSAARDQFANMAEDEAVVIDVATIGAMLLAGPLAPVAEQLAPYVVEGLFAIIRNNTQGRPGSQTPMHGSGARGGANDGGRIEEDDGA